ncbi:putative ribonuclease H-like domain-containing protein [Tanacetum coccineum]
MQKIEVASTIYVITISGRNQGKRSYGDNGRSNAPTNESSSQALVAQDGLGGYDWSNDFEVEPVNYALMAISSSSSSSSSDNENLGYLSMKRMNWLGGEKYEFQNYELKCREIKINNLNLELEKVVKERDELKLKIEKWEESSKNLDELLNRQMSTRDKTSLGYGTQLNEMSNNSETDSEISLSVFEVRSSDEENTPANDRFSKADGFHVVPSPIIGNFLTLRADISFAGLDEYAIRKKIIESKTTDLNTKTSETVGKINEANTQKPKTIYESVNKDKVITEDWNLDDEDDVSEVQTVSPVKTNESQTVKTRVGKIGQTFQKQGIGFKKIKACFVCKITNHLIKDCNFHDKQSQEPKLKTVINTGPRVDKPVWDNTKRVIIKMFQITLFKKRLLSHQEGNPEICFRIPIWQCFKLLDESQVVLRAPRKDDVYSLDLKNIVPSGGLENQLNHNVKIIRCDNGTEFKNHAMNEFCAKKGIKREFSVARTPQQNGVAERKNRTLIEAARTMLADSLLPIPFWAEAVNTACYVLNRVLVTKPQNKTPYELLIGKSPSISFMRPFGCPLTILNTLDSLGKFDGKSDEGYLLGYSTTSKAFRVYNKRTKRVEENLHIDFLEDQPNVAGTGTQDSYVVGSSGKDKEPSQEYILLPLHPHRTRIPVEDVAPAAHEKPSESSPKDNDVQDSEDVADKEGQHQMTEDEQVLHDELEKMIAQEVLTSFNKLSTGRSSVSTATTPYVSAASTPTGANAGESSFVYLGGKIPIDASTLPNADLPIDPNMPDLEDDSDAFSNDGIFNGAYDEENVGAMADFNNMDATINVSPIPTLRINKDHLKYQILGDPKLAVQTSGKIQETSSAQQALVSYISKQNRTNHKDHQNCLLACFLSQEEPKSISQALQDKRWVEAMQEELMEFKLQKVWILVNLPSGKKAIGTKWVFKNKRDERSIVVKNKARLVAQGFRQEEGIDYDEVFAPVAKIEAIRLFLAFASYMGFTVYQMDVKSAFLYGTIEEEVYVHQPPGFVDPAHPNKVYKVIKALYGLHQAPRAWYETLSSFLMENGFRRADILKKFDFWSIRTASTPIESNKPLIKDEDGEDVDVHVYRSMIGSLMYLTASRPNIMFAVCACARFQVTPKASHLNAVKRIFRYLKHQPKLGLWYPRDSPFELEAFSDSDYGGASLDRKSTTGGCQFLGRRLISWQCKKQTIVANSTTKAEYVAAANCCGQVLWIQNQMMDYGFNFMNTRIHIDNESTISVIKNPVAHSRTKHIKIQFHFIRDCYEKRLIEVIKIHTASNVADLLTKGFDVTRFNFLVGSSYGTKLVSAASFGYPKVSTARLKVVCWQPVSISEASIQSNLPFNDAAGIDVLSNQAVFDTIQLMGYSLIRFKKGKKFLENETHFIYPSMLVQPTENEGAVLERPSETQSTPSSSHPSEDPIEPQPYPSLKPSSSNLILDSIPEGSGGNHGGQSSNDASLSGNEDDLTLQSVYDLYLSLCTQKESISKQGKKPAKSKPTVHKDTAFDDLDDIVDDAIDYMETKDAQDEGRISSKTLELSLSGDTMVVEEKESAEKGVSTEDPVSTAEPKVGNSDESATPTMTSTPTPKVFGDDETIAQVFITMSQNKVKQKEKEKGVEIKETEDTNRPRTTTKRSILTLKSLPKIDPKAKGKKKIEEEDESDTESEDITEAEKKFKMLANDEEIARKVQEEWEAEENKKRLAEEEANMAAFTNEYDFIQERLNADNILTEKLQEEERENFTIEQRAKFLHDTVAAQRRFLAQQRSKAIRNKLPTRNQLRNQMMTYLKHVGGYKHAQLNKKKFEEIQVMYEKVKRENERFIPIGSAKDDKLIEKMNKKAAGMDKEEVAKELESSKVEGPKENIRKRSGRRLKMKAPKRSKRQKTNSDHEEENQLRIFLKIVPEEEEKIDYEILGTRYPIINWESKFYDYGHFGRELIYYRVFRADGSSRWIKTFSEMIKLFDRMDLIEIHSLVMKRFETTPPEGIDLLLWGDLRTMFESKEDDELWKNQEEWKLQSWIFYENCSKLEATRKKVMLQMLELKLESEEDNTMALELIRFVKKLIAKLEPKNSDGDEEDL